MPRLVRLLPVFDREGIGLLSPGERQLLPRHFLRHFPAENLYDGFPGSDGERGHNPYTVSGRCFWGVKGLAERSALQACIRCGHLRCHSCLCLLCALGSHGCGRRRFLVQCDVFGGYLSAQEGRHPEQQGAAQNHRQTGGKAYISLPGNDFSAPVGIHLFQHFHWQFPNGVVQVFGVHRYPSFCKCVLSPRRVRWSRDLQAASVMPQ